MARIAFIQDELIEKNGLMSISAVLKSAGHECELFCSQVDGNVMNSVSNFNPDIVGLGFISHEEKYALKTMSDIKGVKNLILTVAGGHHPTLFPDIIKHDCVDIVCRGEGEYSLLELAENLDKGLDFSNIRGLWVKKDGRIHRNELRPLINDLDSLPFLDRELYYKKYDSLKRSPTKSFMASRGCPFRCSFCFNNAYARLFKDTGKYLRYRSPAKIIEEIAIVREKYGMDWVQFQDSTLNSDRTYLRSLLSEYLENSRMPGFLCNLRSELLDEETLALMKKAGCDKVNIGVQHGNENIRRNLAARGTKQSNDEIVSICKLFNKYSIRLYLDFIVGWPGETLEQAFESVGLARKIRPTGVSCFLLTPYYGTDIHTYSVQNGFVDASSDFNEFPEDCGIYENKSIIKQKNINELVNLQKMFHFAVYYEMLDPLIRLLIKFPPNRYYVFLRGLPGLVRRLKYNSKNWRERKGRIKSYLSKIRKVK